MHLSKNFCFFFSLLECLLLFCFFFFKTQTKIEKKKTINKFDVNEILNQPLIFIGGYKSSGTSLVRSILDVHSECKCGPEIKICLDTINFFKKQSNQTSNSFIENKLLKAYGIFAYYNYFKNVAPVSRICNKEPGNFQHIKFFKRVFPNSKFILVVRDGRESSYSWVKRSGGKATFKRFLANLKDWNMRNRNAYKECIETGTDYCKIVYYNKLVTNPKKEIAQMASFLNLEWTDKFLNHEKYLGKDIKLAKHEYSLYGLKKEINSDSLNNWMGKIKDYNEEIVSKEIDMLRTYKYIS